MKPLAGLLERGAFEIMFRLKILSYISSCQELRNFLETAAPLAWDGSAPPVLLVLHEIVRFFPRVSDFPIGVCFSLVFFLIQREVLVEVLWFSSDDPKGSLGRRIWCTCCLIMRRRHTKAHGRKTGRKRACTRQCSTNLVGGRSQQCYTLEDACYETEAHHFCTEVSSIWEIKTFSRIPNFVINQNFYITG